MPKTVIEIFLPILIIIFILALAVPTVYAFFIGAPILYSPKKTLAEALKIAAAKPGEKFCDLGAGSGRAMITAARDFDLQVCGYELSPIFWGLAKLNLFFHGIKNSKLYLKNFYNHDLSAADIIFCFLTPPAMAKLKPKFEKELKPGTRLISYAFSIQDWPVDKIINADNPGKVYIYVKK